LGEGIARCQACDADGRRKNPSDDGSGTDDLRFAHECIVNSNDERPGAWL